MAVKTLDDQAIFEVARKISSPQARQAYLAQICGADLATVERIEALLRAHDDSASFLEYPPPGIGVSPTINQPAQEKPGTQVGPYKLLQQIGEGGMGTVYMAEQKEPVQRKVALKVIKPGMDTFQAPTSISIGDAGSPASVAVGDFNGDGKLDLGVTSNVYFPGTPGYWVPDYYGGTYYPGTPGTPGYYEGRANVLLGNGVGSFSETPKTTTLGYAFHTSASAADVNNDGIDDFVSADSEFGTVSLSLGDSSGYLRDPTDFSAGSRLSVAGADVNGGGNIDLVSAIYDAGTVNVLLGDGHGSFGGAQNYAVGAYPSSIAVADFNADGKPDLVTANVYGDNVSVLLGNGDGTFQASRDSAAGSNPQFVTVGDFNGDSWLDVATTNASGNVSVLINDQSWPLPPPPSVSINDVTVTEGNSGTVAATFTLTLSYASTLDLAVHYATADIAAAAGSDYTAASGDVIIPSGQTSQTLTVAVTGDRLAELTETFAVNLSAPVNATIGDGQGIGTILDDEPRISINDVTVTEGNTGGVIAMFTATLSALSDVDVTAHYATADGTAAAGSDYTATAWDVIIPHGQISRTFTVAVKGDRLVEPTETFAVNLSAPVNAGIADGQGVGTILDNEPRISISDVTKVEG